MQLRGLHDLTKVILHIGLHKTGTTAFQDACFANRESLIERGTLYPIESSLTLGTTQHQGLVASLRFGEKDCIARRVQELAEISLGYETLLLSAEDFCHLFGAEDCMNAGDVTHSALKSAFTEVQYVCVIRNDREILRSTLREMIESTGMPYDGAGFVRSAIGKFYERSERIARTLKGYLKVLRYEELARRGLISSLLYETTGVDLPVSDAILHSTHEKDARQLLLSNMRMLLFNAERTATPYTAEINGRYAAIYRAITIDPEINRQIEDTFADWLSREMDAALSENIAFLSDIFGRA